MEMESQAEESVRAKMESLRLKQIPIQQQKMDSFTSSFRRSLESIRARAQETVQNQGKLVEFKAKLREAEDDMVKAIAVKTRKEVKRMAIMDAITAKRAKIEEIKRSVQEQRAKRAQYAEIISQKSLALAASEEESSEDAERKGETQEAISWYNRVLGFHVEAGHGVKFTFKNINLKNPNEEYSFTIRYENDTYTLLDCDPHLNDTKELIHELNRTNGLFKFVRIMREKFQEVAARGFLPQLTTHHQEYSTISVSAPVLSVSTDRSESPPQNNEHQSRRGEGDRPSKEGHHTTAILSPRSASYFRRSPRFMHAR